MAVTLATAMTMVYAAVLSGVAGRQEPAQGVTRFAGAVEPDVTLYTFEIDPRHLSGLP